MDFIRRVTDSDILTDIINLLESMKHIAIGFHPWGAESKIYETVMIHLGVGSVRKKMQSRRFYNSKKDKRLARCEPFLC